MLPQEAGDVQGVQGLIQTRMRTASDAAAELGAVEAVAAAAAYRRELAKGAERAQVSPVQGYAYRTGQAVRLTGGRPCCSVCCAGDSDGGAP